MNDFCEEYDRFLDGETLDGERALLWRRHLHDCAACREQSAADASLREALSESSPPVLSAEFDARLRRRLDQRRSAAARKRRGFGGLRPLWSWALGGYATAAAFASILILSRLPWESLAVPRGFVLAVGVLLLASPLVLLVGSGLEMQHSFISHRIVDPEK